MDTKLLKEYLTFVSKYGAQKKAETNTDGWAYIDVGGYLRAIECLLKIEQLKFEYGEN